MLLLLGQGLVGKLIGGLYEEPFKGIRGLLVPGDADVERESRSF
jgi:hypothetical protein